MEAPPEIFRYDPAAVAVAVVLHDSAREESMRNRSSC